MGNLKTPALCPHEPPRSCPLSNPSSPFLSSPADLHTDLSVPGLETNQLSFKSIFPREHDSDIPTFRRKKKTTKIQQQKKFLDFGIQNNKLTEILIRDQ